MPWDKSRIDQPFVFFAAGPDTPPPPVTAAEIETRSTQPIRDFPADQAYAAALERDTLQGYEDFLAAYPTSPYAKTVRGLLAARREALTWRHTLDVGTPDAFWSYLQRYPKGPHAAEARRILGRSPPPCSRRPALPRSTMTCRRRPRSRRSISTRRSPSSMIPMMRRRRRR